MSLLLGPCPKVCRISGYMINGEHRLKSTRTTIDDRGALLALPACVDPRVEVVLENRDDIAIPDWPPSERYQRAARVGKVDVLRRHPLQHLPGATQLLQPPIRIEAETHMPVPGVTNRDRDPQLTAFCFRPCCLVHPGSDDPQFELPDAPLHGCTNAGPATRAAIIPSMALIPTFPLRPLPRKISSSSS